MASSYARRTKSIARIVALQKKKDEQEEALKDDFVDKWAALNVAAGECWKAAEVLRGEYGMGNEQIEALLSSIIGQAKVSPKMRALVESKSSPYTEFDLSSIEADTEGDALAGAPESVPSVSTSSSVPDAGEARLDI